MSDTAAALDLGFDSIGRPSNLACMDILCNLVRGRDVIVIGENDAKLNKKTGLTDTPGRDGMIAAFQMVKRACPKATMLTPPTHVKDLRAWVAKYKLTRDQFLEYHAEKGEKHAEELLLKTPARSRSPVRTSTARLRMANRYTVRRWHSAWWKYSGAKYVEVDPKHSASRSTRGRTTSRCSSSTRARAPRP
jgi:hypothetical protein